MPAGASGGTGLGGTPLRGALQSVEPVPNTGARPQVRIHSEKGSFSMSNTLTEWFRHVPEEKWLRDPAASRADAEAIWEKLDLKPGVRVFECPCGKADLGFPLARSGACVQGIDFNSHFVTAARNKFGRAGLAGEFKTADMRTAEFPENMDLIVNWASSFGYFSDEANADLLKRFAASLAPGGRLLIEVANPSRVLAGEATRLIASGEQVCETWDPATKRASVIFPATEYRGPVSASVRVYSCDEYREMLEAAGLTLVDFYGQGFAPFTAASPRLIVLAKK